MFYSYLKQKEEEGRLTCRKDEPLFLHSSFGIGGPADIAVFPKSRDALVDTLRYAKETGTPFRVFGNCTNVLFSDKGVRGAVIFTTDVAGYCFEGEYLTAECGVNLVKLSHKSAQKSLSGLEFACGIPGSVGGAVFMNAGAYGSEMASTVIESEYLDLDTMQIKKITDHGFGYRHSVYKQMNAVILSAKMRLSPDDKDAIRKRMSEYKEKRMSSQPYDKKSAGSTFKRKDPYITARLIDEAGLKGRTVGGASVSEKHAGFIVNEGGATAADVFELINIVKKTVYERFGVEIECEIILEGEMQ